MEPNIKLETGTLLRNGAYRIIEVLGQGGFGITYLAEHIMLGVKVAIKEFFPKDFCDRDSQTSISVTLGTQGNREFVGRLRAKFIKEARNIARLNHPSIIHIQDIFEENNTAYYVMDYIEGSSLQSVCKQHQRLPQSVAVGYVTKIAAALGYIHSQSMIHLDVKPANIMIRASDDTPVLIDFGLSKQYSPEGEQTSTTPVGISHGYAPIEQYRQGGVSEFSPATDIYSLGATLYKLVTGITPPEPPMLIDSGLYRPDGIGDNIWRTISKAMSVTKAGRYASAADFAADLDAASHSVADDDDENTVIAGITGNKTDKPSGLKTEKPETHADEDKADAPRSSKKSLDKLIIVLIAIAVGILIFTIVTGNTGQKPEEATEAVEEATEVVVYEDAYADSFAIADSVGW